MEVKTKNVEVPTYFIKHVLTFMRLNYIITNCLMLDEVKICFICYEM